MDHVRSQKEEQRSTLLFVLAVLLLRMDLQEKQKPSCLFWY
jgi:hypothetical protein